MMCIYELDSNMIMKLDTPMVMIMKLKTQIMKFWCLYWHYGYPNDQSDRIILVMTDIILIAFKTGTLYTWSAIDKK